jgi:putative addiction module component
MSALESLLEQALRLPDAERGKLAMQLLRTLEPEEEDEVSKEEWEAAWSAELDRRVREMDDGSAELLDGDEVLAEARAWFDAQRR